MRIFAFRASALFWLILSCATAGLAQGGGIQTGLTANADNATPQPGSGHDYVHLLAETVSPANGSVDIKINYGAPPSRGVTLPAAFVYDTGSVFSLTQDPVTTIIQFEQPYAFGQFDLFPVATWTESSFQPPANQGNGGEPQQQPGCNYATSFTFRGPDGVMHTLQLEAVANTQGLPGVTLQDGTCGGAGPPVAPVTDGEVTAAFTSPSTTEADVGAWTVNESADPPVTPGPVGPFVVTDAAGTTYFFSGSTQYETPAHVFEEYASYVEDRNGNIIAGACPGTPTVMYCDTAGRPVESFSTTTVTFGGSTFPASGTTVGGVTYASTNGNAGTATINYQVPHVLVYPTSSNNPLDIGCSPQQDWTVPPTSAALVVPVYREQIIALPTNPTTYYQLYFGDYNPDPTVATNNYGLINEIVYPDGGWVKYTWTLPAAPNYTQASTMGGKYMGTGQNSGQPAPFGCIYEYSTPVVSARQVSYDGTTVAQTQSFSYNTNWGTGDSAGTWTQKSTTVQTTDKSTGKTTQTIYTYQPGSLPVPPSVWGAPATEIPLEQTVARYDWGNTTKPLDVETKSWLYSPLPQLACDFHTLNNGQSTGHFYQYSSVAPSQISDDKEYDYGQIASPASVCAGSAPTAPSSPTPIRETVTNYQSFTSPLSGARFAKPSSVLIYGNGAKIAETDYGYDQASLAPVTAINHDETTFKPGNVGNRANATTVTRQCIGCANATTTYTYDETGQLASMTDPCGNAACSDMTGASHTTTYSFTDSPSGGNSAGNSNAYLTTVTNPISQTRSYQYNYTSGELTQATDENLQPTKYCYTTGGCSGGAEDGLYRLTGISYPDGGSKIITYSDSAPSPSVTTQTAINASVSMKTETVMDGMGHVVDSYVSSDPNGQVDVHTNYDGFGRAWKVSNSYRPSTDTAYFTVNVYDALGRKITQTQPDGTSVLQWCYNNVPSGGQTNCLANKTTLSSLAANSWVDFSDEDGHHWQRSYDGLGRLRSVMEPNSSNVPAIETDYSYDALNDLLGAVQNGVSGESARSRSFSYDSLGRLLSASNPETGLVCYGAMANGTCVGGGYDANGNVAERTDARGVATNYAYDALNRLLGKTYANDPSASPSSCYQYDLSTVQYGVGRLANQWTQSASAGLCPSSPPSTGIWTRRAILQYDKLGRVLSEQQYTPATLASGKPYAPAYTYDLAGNLITSTDGVTPAPTTPGATLTFTNCIDGSGRLQALASNWSDSTHPQSLFSAQGPSATPCPTSTSAPTLSSATYAAFGGLTNAMLGNGLKLTRTYDNRLRITAETDTGVATPASTTGSATVPVTGAEQSQ